MLPIVDELTGLRVVEEDHVSLFVIVSNPSRQHFGFFA